MKKWICLLKHLRFKLKHQTADFWRSPHKITRAVLSANFADALVV